MSAAAIMSPLGTTTMMPKQEEELEEAHAISSPLFHESLSSGVIQDDDDNDSVPSLSEDNVVLNDCDDDNIDMEMTPEETKDEDEDNDQSQMDAAASFGGLINLGNTCYLNSALQMLTSLDGFARRLVDDDDASKPPSSSSSSSLQDKLRAELVDIFTRLQRGETSNPTEFKKAMDARSHLFVGYRQQDSHEFLTTLLDLLDEDYHHDNSSSSNKPKEEENDGGDGEDKDETMQEESTEDVEQQDETQDTVPIIPASHELAKPSRSLSELENDDIRKLLHGSSESSLVVMETSTHQEEEYSTMEPQCKLVGGRAAVVPMCGVMTHHSCSSATAEQVDDAARLRTTTEQVPVSDSTRAMSNTDEAQQQQEAEESETNREPTLIEDYFATEIRAQLTCDSCKYTRSQVETYLHLSLDIGSDSGSVEEGLRKFFAPERREVKCEKCFCETATQTLEITKLPRALLVHCKRFLVDVSPDYTSVSYRKNQSPFTFNGKLSIRGDEGGILDEYLAEDVYVPARSDDDDDDEDMGVATEQRSYQIRSVVNHIGSRASCGHYTCDANRMYANGERQWTRFNDSRVSHVSVEDAMGASAQKTAYMVMYELEQSY